MTRLVDVRVEAETDGRAGLRATVDAATPQLVLERGMQRLEMGGTRLAIEVTCDASTPAVSVRRFTIGDLVPETTGTLRAGGWRRAEVDVQGDCRRSRTASRGDSRPCR